MDNNAEGLVLHLQSETTSQSANQGNSFLYTKKPKKVSTDWLQCENLFEDS